MASPEWKISGDYFEACSCDSVCPCPTSGLAARPTQGYCDAGLVFHVERGSHGATKLDGLNFAVLLNTPGAMGAGNWTVWATSPESKPSRSASSPPGCAGPYLSRGRSTSPSRELPVPSKPSRFTSTMSVILPPVAWPSRKPPGATCTRSGSTGTTPLARTTVTSLRSRGARVRGIGGRDSAAGNDPCRGLMSDCET